MSSKQARSYPPFLSCHGIAGFLLMAAALALGAAAIFFVAANWQALGRWGRFALVEGALILSVLGALRFPLPSRAASALLLVASVLTGALLGLVGQSYQLGADRWELFAWWALLILPWVLAARSHLLWGLWALILQTALWLYLYERSSFWHRPEPWEGSTILLLVDGVILGLFEATARRWGAERFDAVRLLMVAGASAATVWMAVERQNLLFPLIFASAWYALIAWYYGLRQRRLPILAAGSLGLLLFSTAMLIHLLPWGRGWVLSLLVVTLAVFALGGTLIRLLLSLREEDPSRSDSPRSSLWAIHFFSAASGWIAALLSVVLIGAFLLATLRLEMDQARLLAAAAGLGLLAAVRLRLPRSHDPRHTHFWLAWSLIAQGWIFFALFGVFESSSKTLFGGVALLEGLLFFAIPHPIHRAVSAFFFFIALWLWSAEISRPYLFWIVSLAALLAALATPLYRRYRREASALVYGTLLAALAGEGLSLLSRAPHTLWLPDLPDQAQAARWADILLAALAGGWTGRLIRRDLLAETAPPYLPVLGALLTGLGAYHHPGAAVGILAAMLGAYRAERLPAILGILIALTGIGLYYYTLDQSLLYKAAALGLSGAVLLAAALIHRRLCPRGASHA